MGQIQDGTNSRWDKFKDGRELNRELNDYPRNTSDLQQTQNKMFVLEVVLFCDKEGLYYGNQTLVPRIASKDRLRLVKHLRDSLYEHLQKNPGVSSDNICRPNVITKESIEEYGPINDPEKFLRWLSKTQFLVTINEVLVI